MNLGKLCFGIGKLPVLALFGFGCILHAEVVVDSLTIIDHPFQGDLPSTTALGVSANGNVVVGMTSYYSEAVLYKKAFRWEAGTAVEIPDLGGNVAPVDSRADDVSENGLVIVGKGRTATEIRAMVWYDTVGADIGFDGASSWVNSISDDGLVYAGGRQSNTTYRLDSVVWFDGEAEIISEFEGGPSYSQGWGVSPDGSVVVGEMDTASGHQAFLWSTSTRGPFVGLGELPGGNTFGQARAASNGGLVIVGISMSDMGEEGFVWEDKIMTGLGQLGNSNCGSEALDVSGDGNIIVGKSCVDSLPVAVLWQRVDNGWAIQSLNNLVYGEEELTENDFSLQTAHAISTDGTTIVGYGLKPAERFKQGFILKVKSGDSLNEWGGFTGVDDKGNVDTGDFMGTLNVSSAPHVWSFDLGGWVYCDEAHVSESGGWMYFLK